MPNIYDRLFTESFETLDKSDELEGVKTPYERTAADMVGTALNDLQSLVQDFSSGITTIYQQLEPSMVVSAKGNLTDRKQMSKNFSDALSANNILADDSLIRTKLSDILAYLYGRMNGGKYLILTDFSKAKQMASSLYSMLKRQRGYPVVSASVDDLLKKVILAVVYKADFNHEHSNKPTNPPPKQ